MRVENVREEGKMKEGSKERKKIKFWTFTWGRVCVLWAPLLFTLRIFSSYKESLWWWWNARKVVGEIRGVPLTSKRQLSLQAIFNWTLIRYLPGPSSFWSRRGPWQLYACLKASGRHVRALVLYVNPSAVTDTGLRIYTSKASINYCFFWQANLKSSTEMQVPRCIKRRPDETKYHD